MAINFPSNREEANLGTGPLEAGDEWSYNNIDYTYTFAPNNEPFWTAKLSTGTVDVKAGDGIYIGADDSVNVDTTVARLTAPADLSGSRVSDYVTDFAGNHVNVFRADQANTNHDRKPLATEEWVEAYVGSNSGGGDQGLDSVLANGNTTSRDMTISSDDGVTYISPSGIIANKYIMNELGFDTGMQSPNDTVIQFVSNGDPKLEIAYADSTWYNKVNFNAEVFDRNGNEILGQPLPRGTYTILDPIFGGYNPVPSADYRDRCTPQPDENGVYYWLATEDGGSITGSPRPYRDWSAAFNYALSGFDIGPLAWNQTGDWDETEHNKSNEEKTLHNGMIDTLLVPVGTYDCYYPVKRTRTVSMLGIDGRAKLIFALKDRHEAFETDNPDDEEEIDTNKGIVWNAPVLTNTCDGLSERGQLWLANKGTLQNIAIAGDQKSKDTAGSNSDYSTVLAFRRYDNKGVPFEHAGTSPESKQQDAADMDTGFIDCAFGGIGDGIKGSSDNIDDATNFCRNGMLKYVGRNAYIMRCAFNHNKSGIVLTFPNDPGRTRLEGAGESYLDCTQNNSAWNKSQGGIYGWRRTQIQDCYFHMNKAAQCITVYGRYQMSGMIIANNLADIGGQLLEVVGGSFFANSFSNGVGGGLKNCTIVGNSFANYDRSNNGEGGALIHFKGGRYDNNTISGNSLYGSDFTGFYPEACDNAPAGKSAYSKTKRPRYHILMESPTTGMPLRIYGLSITGNNLGYSSDSSIRIQGSNTVQALGVAINGNTFLGIGSGVARNDSDVGFSVNSNSKCFDPPADNRVRGVMTGNTCTQTFAGGCTSFIKGSVEAFVSADPNNNLFIETNIDQGFVDHANDVLP